MNTLLNKISTPVQVSAVLLAFTLYAAATAHWLNTPPTAPEAPVAPVATVEPATPTTDVVVVSILADLVAADEAVCRDAHTPLPEVPLQAAAPKAEDPQADESTPPKPKKPEPPYHRLILQAAVAHDVEPALIKAVILAESNYNPRAVSKRGARGLMQLMPRTAASLGVADAFDPADNINGGVKYLRQLLDRFDNDVRLALAAYNAGSRHVRNYNGVPPFRATRLYIKKVFKFQALYQEEMESMRQTV